MLAQLLHQKGFRATELNLVYGKRNFSLAETKQSHIFHRPKFYEVFVNDSQFIQAISQMPYQDAIAYCAQEIDKFCAEYAERKAQEDEEEKIVEYNEQQQDFLNTHVYVASLDGHDNFIWSKANRRISVVALNFIKTKFRGKQLGKLMDEAPVGTVTYNPYKGLESMWVGKVEDKEVTFCNAYVPPIWYTQDYDRQQMAAAQETYPPLFTWIITNLIPDLYDLNYTLNWMAQAAFDRCDSYLLLRGARGNGKTIFKTILYHLVGSYLEAQEKSIGAGFNAELENKRIVGLDDHEEVGTKKGNIWRKRITNAMLTYNRKHVQTEKTGKQCASIVICCNPSNQFYLEHDERKIVSPTSHSNQNGVLARQYRRRYELAECIREDQRR